MEGFCRKPSRTTELILRRGESSEWRGTSNKWPFVPDGGWCGRRSVTGPMPEPSRTLARLEDSALVAEAKAGSFAAFEELVSRHERRIYRLGLTITGSPDDAEDVLQETFLKAFVHLQEFREDARFSTWLVRIAVNEGLMLLRRRRDDKWVPVQDPVDEEGAVMPREFADWRPNPEQVYARAELEDLLLRAARSLPAAFRAVFFLRDVEGLSTEETAQVLGVSVGAVKARLFRARMKLRDELTRAFCVGKPRSPFQERVSRLHEMARQLLRRR